jgi:hypothetical protein
MHVGRRRHRPSARIGVHPNRMAGGVGRRIEPIFFVEDTPGNSTAASALSITRAQIAHDVSPSSTMALSPPRVKRSRHFASMIFDLIFTCRSRQVTRKSMAAGETSSRSSDTEHPADQYPKNFVSHIATPR